MWCNNVVICYDEDYYFTEIYKAQIFYIPRVGYYIKDSNALSTLETDCSKPTFYLLYSQVVESVSLLKK